MIDANILVRVLSQHQPEHAGRATKFLQQVAVSQRANPLVLAILLGLSVIALVLADQYVTSALNRPEFNVQWFFRLLALAIVVAVMLFVMSRRRASEQHQQAPGSAD